MSDSNDKKSGTLTLSSSKLQLGDIKGGQVPQSLSHGRVKSVKVEVVRKKRRSLTPEELLAKKKAKDDTAKNATSQQEHASGKAQVDDRLTDGERNARLNALKKASEDQEKQKQEEAALKEKEANQPAPQEPVQDENTKPLAKDIGGKEPVLEESPAQEESKPKPKEEAKSAESSSNVVRPVKSTERVQTPVVKEKKKTDKKESDKSARMRDDQKRRSNKLTIAEALSNREDKTRSLASVKRAREKARRAASQGSLKDKEKIIRDVVVPEVITVQELANRMAERVFDVTKALMKMGMMVTANQTIDADTAELVISEFGHKIKRVTEADVENVLLEDDRADDSGQEVSRAPVVTFMGHVDHGKTSLLDAIRKEHVADGEAGGITQHIGAYQVQTDAGDKITFLDTPGHEAFTEMRKRGASATDIVVLVVAADDGIMAQTVEAINHAKAAEVPIIIAINKIDKPGADADRIRNELLSHEIIAEELGGDTLVAEVSAKKGTNLDKLLDAILLQAEVLELRANPERKAAGTVVEAKVDKGRGVVCTVLVQKGTLKLGDIIVAGLAYGRVRAMVDAAGVAMVSAGPSMPVEILGLNEAPLAGSNVAVVNTEKQAREITEYRHKRDRDLRSAVEKRGSLEELFLQASQGGIKELPIVIKSDVQGSSEAILSSLNKLANDEVAVRALHTAVGGITESDISLASASRAIVLGFNVRADTTAKELAAKDGIDIRYYSIIYDLIDDIKALLGGMLKPEVRENYLGNAEIREVFNVSKAGKVAGCYVTEGMIKRGAGVRLLRDNVVIHVGTLKTLRRFIDEVIEVGTYCECGMAFENYDDIKAGDVIEAFELIEEKRSL